MLVQPSSAKEQWDLEAGALCDLFLRSQIAF
jgi:hypothetical protein